MLLNKKRLFYIKAVIFDMDGVITNTMPDHFTAWQKTMADAGIEVSELEIYSREGQRGLTSLEEIYASNNLPFDPEEGKVLLQKKEDLFKQITKTRFIAGSRTFLKHLAKNEITMALVTGTSHHEMREILPEDLQSLFQVVVTGCQVKNGKPNPEPYRTALQRLDLRADDAVVIENAPFGIQSARQAGLRCLALETSLPKEHLFEADQVFSSIKELRESVEFLPKG